ncbi:zinc-binding dehydrogenase [Alkalibacillus salilacus]|uniref:Zinc-binding alcohol dehydrogenase/oxidoreductase n=1 Tax=Alkalibacillus salilacus TaxID=284582 RepID=A0ABT9VH51_9BACI|nr:zinc-binding dehydrogenase [Alkalibacillus salilacus]MDQ0160249.1 zinc-binding alcohol dehydrogenase/oxidoreductase [Alkalibacillus salilacus]
MKAIVHEKMPGLDGLAFQDIQEPSVGVNEVKVKLKTAGLNRRDISVTGRRQEGADPLVLGSDGAGIIEEVGAEVSDWKPGDEVIINPGIGWIQNDDAPPKGFQIVGLPDDGTFAEYYVVNEQYIERKPTSLNWDEAGVVALAGLTAYRAVFTRGNIQAGDTVLLPGIGSGVLTYALKFLKAIGARVIVTSRLEAKLETAKSLGADRGVLTTSDWQVELADETIDVVIESVGRATFQKSIEAVRRGGTIVMFGATTEDTVEFDLRQFFYGQYNLLGTTMGSVEELREMLSFVDKYGIKPEIDTMFTLDQYAEAFEYLRDSNNFGKVGFRIE